MASLRSAWLACLVAFCSATSNVEVQVTKYRAAVSGRSPEAGGDDFSASVTISTGAAPASTMCAQCNCIKSNPFAYARSCEATYSYETGVVATEASAIDVSVHGWEDDIGDRCTFDLAPIPGDNFDDDEGTTACNYPLADVTEGEWHEVTCGDAATMVTLRFRWTAAAPLIETEHDAIFAIKSALGGLDAWTGTSLCSFPGIGCTPQGAVERIDLSDLTTNAAPLPDLAVLTTLRILSVKGTSVTGFGSLPTSLVDLDFSWTDFSSEMPPVIATLSNLVTLRAKAANLEGTLPAFPEALITIDVSQNELSGAVPTLPVNVRNFIGRYNGFSRALPGSESVLRMVVNNNNFEGTIPAYPKLTHGHFHHNALTGTYVPADMPEAHYIDVSHNSMNGVLPNLAATKVEVFKGYRNNFVGGFHFAAPGQRVMAMLYVNYNNLSGKQPTPAEALLVAARVKVSNNGWD